MIRLRSGDRGFHHHNTDCFITIVILGVLAAIAIPSVLGYRARRGTTCLNHLVAAMDGKRPAGAACPYTQTAYAAAACPAPSGHLDSSPRFVKTADGAWRLEQTLPAYAGKPLELGPASAEARGNSIHVKPHGFTKYLLGPLLTLVLVAIWIVCAVWLGMAIKSREWPAAIFPLITLAAMSGFVYGASTSFAASQVWTFEKGRVVRTDYLFGSRRGEQAWTGCLGVVPVPTSNGGRRGLQLVHAERDGRRTTLLDTIPADRLDIAAWINKALETGDVERPK